jgi:hypothetical protein
VVINHPRNILKKPSGQGGFFILATRKVSLARLAASFLAGPRIRHHSPGYHKMLQTRVQPAYAGRQAQAAMPKAGQYISQKGLI